MHFFQNIANQVRHWDNQSNQWFTKNFSILFFELVLAVIFVFFINHMMDIFALSSLIKRSNLTDQILLSQSGLMLLLVLLLLFNSFLMLYMFGNMMRLRNILKNIDYNTSQRRSNRTEE